MNNADEVMTEHFQQGFVALGNRRLTADGVAELPLDSGEGRFDVRPLVVLSDKFIPVELKKMEQAIPGRRFSKFGVRLERHKWCGPKRFNQVEVELRPVRFVGADSLDVEVARRLGDERGQHGASRPCVRLLRQRPSQRSWLYRLSREP